jgi:hypothetical protein
MFGTIIAAFSNFFGNVSEAKRNSTEIALLKTAVSRLEAEHGKNQQTIVEIRDILQHHERRLLYLEMWKECQGDCQQMIKDLGRVQEDQKRSRIRLLQSVNNSPGRCCGN